MEAKNFDKMTKDLPKIAVLTVAILCEKYKINGSVARKILREFTTKGLIKQVGDHNQHITVYTGTQVGKAEQKEAPEEKKAGKKSK